MDMNELMASVDLKFGSHAVDNKDMKPYLYPCLYIG